MFQHPAKLPIQIIGPTTLRKARDAYRARWGRWGHCPKFESQSRQGSWDHTRSDARRSRVL